MEDLVALLSDAGVEHWATWFAEVKQRLERSDSRSFEKILGAYGGMGSFNDLLIHPRNGHSVSADRLEAVNATLDKLRGDVSEQARWLEQSLR